MEREKEKVEERLRKTREETVKLARTSNFLNFC